MLRSNKNSGYFLGFIFLTLIVSGTAAAEKIDLLPAWDILKPEYILQDSNQDKVIDKIFVWLILPEEPTEAETAAAANISARLSFESSAIEFDLVLYDRDDRDYYERPVIIISRRNRLLPLALSVDEFNSNRTSPGQGDITFFKENSVFKKGGLVISGYDASGLLAAADYISSRYPDIWTPGIKSLSDVFSTINKDLTENNIAAAEIFPYRIVVDKRRPGLEKLVVKVKVSQAKDYSSLSEIYRPEKKVKKKNGKTDRKKLVFPGLHHLELRIQGPEAETSLVLAPEKEWEFKTIPAMKYREQADFSLASLFSLEGIFTDSNKDYVPDGVDGFISLSGPLQAEGIINLAARTGLETAGMRLPFVKVGGEEHFTVKQGFPILFGLSSWQKEKLRSDKKLFMKMDKPGAGFIQFVSKGFNQKNGIVFSGSDKAGLNAIANYAALHLPYLWQYGKGNFRLDDVATDVRRFFQTRNAAGQTAAALYKLKTWLERIKTKQIESLEVIFSLKEIPAGLKKFTLDLLQNKFPDVLSSVNLHKTGYGAGKNILEESLDITWEVDEFWQNFRQTALPKISKEARGTVTVTVSESPQVRAQLKTKIETELRSRGVTSGAVEVNVLCAYKQGFSWLHDFILPRLKGKDVKNIEIEYHTLKDSKEVRWQTVQADSRWLQEIFPIDSILARELSIPESAISFTAKQEKDPIYRVKASDIKGQLVLAETFSPKYVLRPFFDLFPEYESVRVTTGWVTVEINDRVLLDRRIKTDPERFWDHLQSNTFRKMLEYVMDIQDGAPAAANAPYFDEFIIDLTLSEPNYRLGIDEEVISSTEALHEDILFHTLAFFNRIGGRYDAGSLRYPGRILPYVRPPLDGRSGKAYIKITGKAKAVPALELCIKEKGQDPERKKYLIPLLGTKAPLLRGISIDAAENKLNELLFEVTATDKSERYEEFKLRGTEEQIDRDFISAEKYAAMIKILAEMHQHNIFSSALSYDRVNKVNFLITLEDDQKFQHIVSLPQSSAPLNTVNPSLSADEFSYQGQRLIQWDTPMPPDEANSSLAKLNFFPEINTYFMTRSFLGQKIFAAELFSPVNSSYVSQAKLNALKPTLLLFGRVHGNEVSSTSHILRLAELCATDPVYKEYLKNVNLVLYPVTNPDGAQLAYEMQQENPDFMLHAGRYGALGTDVSSRQPNNDNLYPETGQVYKLRETWLPDVVIDMHGVPSHEWIQYFAGYSAWVNSRKGGARSYWLPRGWYIPGFNWIEDDKYPELMQAQKALTDAVVTAVTSQKEVDAANKRVYKRYIKYGRQDLKTYREYFYKGIQFEARMKARKIKKTDTGITGPHVTYFSIVTEAADETARKDWLKLMCRAGLAHSTALLKYLSEGENRITKEVKDYNDFVIRRIFRKKPVLPKKEDSSASKITRNAVTSPDRH